MVAVSKFWIVGLVLLVLSIGVNFYAYKKHGQFYPACMHLLRSNASYVPLMCTFFYFCILVCMGLQAVFFGPLRIIEHEVIRAKFSYI